MTLQAQGIIRLITDPETTPAGQTTVTKFFGGIQEGKDKNGNYINNSIDCECWGKSGETIQSYLAKGDSFVAIGQILRNEWEGKDGKRIKHIFKITRMEFLPKPKDDVPTQAVAPAVDASIPF